jgi:hypothetical protein
MFMKSNLKKYTSASRKVCVVKFLQVMFMAIAPARRKKKPRLPLRSLWSKAFGDAALPLLAELRVAFQISPYRLSPRDTFETYARRIVRHCESKIPDTARRLEYINACFSNLEKPASVPEPKGYDETHAALIARIGKPAAARFIEAFYTVPLYDPEASLEVSRNRFIYLVSKALSTRHTDRYLQTVVKNGKKERKPKPQKKTARHA